MTVPIGGEYDEVYLNYNWKFSKEYNSTHGGKLTGFEAFLWIRTWDLILQEADLALPASSYSRKRTRLQPTIMTAHRMILTDGRGLLPIIIIIPFISATEPGYNITKDRHEYIH